MEVKLDAKGVEAGDGNGDWCVDVLGVCACMRVRVYVYMPVCMHAMCTCGVCECTWVCVFGAGGI